MVVAPASILPTINTLYSSLNMPFTFYHNAAIIFPQSESENFKNLYFILYLHNKQDESPHSVNKVQIGCVEWAHQRQYLRPSPACSPLLYIMEQRVIEFDKYNPLLTCQSNHAMGKRKSVSRDVSLNHRKTQALNMQNPFFNKATIKNPEANLPPIAPDKPSSSHFSQDDFCSDSLNELNVAFIAEESKLLFSDSQSVVSQGLSISGISVIRGNGRIASPLINLRLQEQFSGLEDWSVQHNITFNKTNLKRANPSIDQQENQQQIQNRCTKRKMNEKMKVLTINSTVKPVQKVAPPTGYMLRSRAKANLASESSSNQELREMINDIQEQEIGAIQNKNKLRLK